VKTIAEQLAHSSTTATAPHAFPGRAPRQRVPSVAVRGKPAVTLLRDKPSSDTARVTTKKISFKPTSLKITPRSGRPRPASGQRPTANGQHPASGASGQVAQVFGTYRSVLARHLEKRQELVDDPSLIPNAVKEVLQSAVTGHPAGHVVVPG